MALNPGYDDMDGGTVTNSMLDSRMCTKPKEWAGPGELKSNEDDWATFAFRFETFLSSFAETFGDELERARRHMEQIELPVDQVQRQRSVSIYSTLVGILIGKPLKILKAVPRRNGFESWRLLELEYNPQTSTIRLLLLGRVVRGDHLRGSTLLDFEDNLMRWEEGVKEHDIVAEHPATDDMKKITVIQSVPQ